MQTPMLSFFVKYVTSHICNTYKSLNTFHMFPFETTLLELVFSNTLTHGTGAADSTLHHL